MHPVVEPPEETVRVLLDARLAASVLIGDELLLVHLQVAVGVLHQPHVRRLGDQHAGIEDLQRSGEDQVVGKDRALVHAAVVIGVFEHDDLADRLHERFGSLKIRDEPWHLDDPEASLQIPIHDDGILDERFACDQLQVISGRHVERFQRVFGRQRRRVVADLLHIGRPLPIGRRTLAVNRRGGRTDDEHDHA